MISDKISKYYTLISSIKDANIERTYIFMPNDDYAKMTDSLEVSKIYWHEMLCRAHIVVLVSLFRTKRWLDSINATRLEYYGFCSSLRGMIESVADSFYTLQSVPLTIAHDFYTINKILQKESSVLIHHEKLENTLLHFIQATKLSQTQRQGYPSFYNAKQTKEYLESIKEISDGRLVFLYDTLCQISHPAYESNSLFLFKPDNRTIVCSDSEAMEESLINAMLKSFSNDIEHLFNVYMVNCISTIQCLNKFNIVDFMTSPELINDLPNPGLGEIDNLINNSKAIYERDLAIGKRGASSTR